MRETSKSKAKIIFFFLIIFITLGIIIVSNLAFKGNGAAFFGLMLLLCAIFILAFSFGLSSSKTSNQKKDTNAALIETAIKLLENETSPLKRKILQNYVDCKQLYNEQAELKLKYKRISKKKNVDQIQLQEILQRIKDVEGRISNSLIDVEKDLNSEQLENFRKACVDFKKIIECERIWYVSNSVANNTPRSSVGSTVKRVEVSAETGQFGLLKSSCEVPVLCHGKYKFYFYPKFIIRAKNELDFVIEDLDMCNMQCGIQSFVEEDYAIPSDAVITGYSYRYVCLDGTPDMRYSYNPRRPNVEYGRILFTFKGFNQCFHYSNVKVGGAFSVYFNSAVKHLAISNHLMDRRTYPAVDMSESYFGCFMTIVKDLERFAQNRIATNKSVTDFIKESYHIKSHDGSTELPIPTYRILLCYDTWHCLTRLGHNLNSLDNECLAFALFASYLLIPDIRKDLCYKMLPGFKANVYTKSKNLVFDLIGGVPACPDGDGFHLYYVLNEIDKELCDEYMRHIHRFARTLARANGSVSTQEDAWIATLLKRAGSYELQEYDEFFEDAARLLVVQAKIEKEFRTDAKFLSEHLGIKKVQAEKVLYQLQLADIVGDEDNYHQREILMTPHELDAYISNFRGHIPFAQSTYQEGTAIEKTSDKKTDSNNVSYVLDPMFDECARLIVDAQNADPTIIQKKFMIGPSRTKRMMGQLEQAGIISPILESGKRTVIPQDREALQIILDRINGEGTIISKESSARSTSSGKKIVQRMPATSNSTDKLNDLIGLQSVKDEVRALANFIKVQKLREEKGLPTTPISYHCVFTGNPGTGKTTVARIIAGIYQELGLLTKGHLIETDRSGLVAEYVGQTATKTNKIIDSAMDGVLFIDEAYSLVTGTSQDYGNEAISTLLKRMEDERGRLVVILAGYGSEMKKFIDSNPGLQSRFNRYIHFPDYDTQDLLAIYKKNLEKHKYVLTAEAEDCIQKKLCFLVENKDKNFGNARMVRNLFEKTIENQATRLSSFSEITEDALCSIQLSDVEKL